MHGNYLVVSVSDQKVIFGDYQLQPDQDCFQTGQQKEEKTGTEVKDADFFVIHGGEPFPDFASFDSILEILGVSACEDRRQKQEKDEDD